MLSFLSIDFDEKKEKVNLPLISDKVDKVSILGRDSLIFFCVWESYTYIYMYA